jgi:hypothetical protein
MKRIKENIFPLISILLMSITILLFFLALKFKKENRKSLDFRIINFASNRPNIIDPYYTSIIKTAEYYDYYHILKQNSDFVDLLLHKDKYMIPFL